MAAKKKFLYVCTALALLLAPAYAQEASPTWSYDGENDNQERWGDLGEEFSLCLLGLNQSPIQIAYTEPKALPKITPLYKESPAQAQYKDKALFITVDGGNTLAIGSKTYRLKHIAFHSPGEHTVLGQFFFAEIEFYHEDSKGHPLILSSFIKVTPIVNETLETILEHLPGKNITDTKLENIRINPAKLLPQTLGYYAYSGSLTTPPAPKA